MSIITRIALATTVLGTIGLTGCTTENDRNMMAEAAIRGSNVEFDAENGDFNYLYRYYPNESVYQSVYNGTWYWPTASGWRYGEALPDANSVAGHYQLIELPSQKPFTEHAQVAAKFPDRETLAARALAYDLAIGRRSSDELGAGDEVFATAPTDNN